MKKISKKVYETQTIKLFGEKPDKRAIKTGFSWHLLKFLDQLLVETLYKNFYGVYCECL